MARAVLRLLHDGDCLEGFDNSGDLLGLMAHDNHGLARLQRFASAHNMFDERASASAVEHFRQTGFKPGAFPGRKNDDG